MVKTTKIPKKFQGLLWSVDVKDLNPKENQWYIIHQFLIYGTFEELRWLFKNYSKKEIIRVFVATPSKNYPDFIYHFVKNYLLGLKDINLDENDYVTSIHKVVKPRATASL